MSASANAPVESITRSEPIWNIFGIAGVDPVEGDAVDAAPRRVHVEADDVVEPKAAASRPPEKRPGDGVDGFDREPQPLCDMDRFVHAPHAEPVRDEKAKVFHAMRPIIPADVVRGQYIAGTADGKPVPGYTEEGGVAPGSRMETFAAMRLFIDNWRWSGVPFYLRTGKRLPQRATEVEVNFRRPPLSLFRELGVEDLQSNHLTLCIQPGESITFEFNTKVPGPEMELRTEPMVFSYEHSFMKEPDEAYERLLHDAMFGDHTLFVREDAVEQAWRVIEPVLTQPPPVHPYPAGTWGPPEAAALIKPYSWHLQ